MQIQSLDIILPCYNPPKDWDAHLQEQIGILSVMFGNFPFRILMVNDGSPEMPDADAIKVLEETGKFIYLNHEKNQGKGAALRTGVSQSEADMIVCTDFDFPFGMECIPAALKKIEEGADVVAGKRGAHYHSRLSGLRKAASQFLIFCNQYLLQLPVTETQAGFKAFNQAGKKMFLATTIPHFLFDTEFIVLSKKQGLKITEVDLILKDQVHFSDFSKKVFMRESGNLLKILFR